MENEIRLELRPCSVNPNYLQGTSYNEAFVCVDGLEKYFRVPKNAAVDLVFTNNKPTNCEDVYLISRTYGYSPLKIYNDRVERWEIPLIYASVCMFLNVNVFTRMPKGYMWLEY